MNREYIRLFYIPLLSVALIYIVAFTYFLFTISRVVALIYTVGNIATFILYKDKLFGQEGADHENY